MSSRLGLDEQRHDTFSDYRLRFENLEWQLRFRRGLVKSEVLV